MQKKVFWDLKHFPERGMEDVYILKLKNLLPADAGKYKCFADNGHNKPATYSVVLKVTGKIQQTNTYSNSLISEVLLLKFFYETPIILTQFRPMYHFYICLENIRFSLVFWPFQGVWKWNICWRWVKELFWPVVSAFSFCAFLGSVSNGNIWQMHIWPNTIFSEDPMALFEIFISFQNVVQMLSV